MSDNDGQTRHPPELTDEQWAEMAKEDLYPVEHKTEITICYVSGNDLGDRTYGLYIEDKANLEKPIGLEVYIRAEDGKVSVHVGESALEVLVFLKPELEEQLAREQEEALDRELAAQQ